MKKRAKMAIVAIIIVCILSSGVFVIIKALSKDFATDIRAKLKDTQILNTDIVGFGLVSTDRKSGLLTAFAEDSTDEVPESLNLVGINMADEIEEIIFKKIDSGKEYRQQKDINASISRYAILDTGFTVFQYTSNKYLDEDLQCIEPDLYDGETSARTTNFYNSDYTQVFIMDNNTGRIYSVAEAFSAFEQYEPALNNVDIEITVINNILKISFCRYLCADEDKVLPWVAYYQPYINDSQNLAFRMIADIAANSEPHIRAMVDKFGNIIMSLGPDEPRESIADDVIIIEIDQYDYYYFTGEDNIFYRSLISDRSENLHSHSNVEYLGENGIWQTASNSNYLIRSGGGHIVYDSIGGTYVLKNGKIEEIFNGKGYLIDNKIIAWTLIPNSSETYDPNEPNYKLVYVCDFENAKRFYETKEATFIADSCNARSRRGEPIITEIEITDGVRTRKEYRVSYINGEFTFDLVKEVSYQGQGLKLVDYFG